MLIRSLICDRVDSETLYMSAEDELVLNAERPPWDEPHAAEFAKFWDDSDSDDRNIHFISWWLCCDGPRDLDPD